MCEKILQDCINVYMLWRFEIWESPFNSYTIINCLMGTITFEVYPITPTSPRIHTCNHIQSIFDLFAFYFLCIFLFKQIMYGHWWCFNYQWAELSSMLSIKGSLVNPERWTVSQRRPVEAGQESSDGKVSIFMVFCSGKMKGNVSMVTFFVDQCFYSTPTEQSSPFM